MDTIMTIAQYWESHGYSKEEAKRIEREQIEDIMAEAEFNDSYDFWALENQV